VSPVQLLQPHQTRSDTIITTDQQPLKLLYQAAIDRINEEVAPYLGDHAIQRGYNSAVDVSPEATANRIVSMTTSLFGLFRQQHSEETMEAVVTRFVEVIGSGIEKGFAEAREILSGLRVLEGEIETNIDRTFELTMSGLASFADELLGTSSESSS
jgi:hypothetical protein